MFNYFIKTFFLSIIVNQKRFLNKFIAINYKNARFYLNNFGNHVTTIKSNKTNYLTLNLLYTINSQINSANKTKFISLFLTLTLILRQLDFWCHIFRLK